MGFTEDFLAEMNSSAVQKRKKTRRALRLAGDDFTREFLMEMANEDEEDIAPTVSTTVEPEPEGLKPTDLKWYEKGLFADGYDFGDFSKTILGIDDKKTVKTFEAPETTETLEELKKKQEYYSGRAWNTAEQQAESLKYTQQYNQMALAQYSDTLSKTKMDGQSHTVLEEIEILANMKPGKEKDQRKEAVLKKMESLGMDSSFYAHFAGDGEFDWNTFGQWLGNSAMAGLNTFNKGLLDTADILLGAPLKAMGWENNPISKGAEYYGNLHESYRYNANILAEKMGSGAWNFGTDAIEGTLGAVPNAVLAIMSGGQSMANTTSSLMNQAAKATGNFLTKAGLTVEAMMKNPQFWTSFARTLGSDYKEAKEMGASDTAAAVGSVLTSMFNAGIEIGPDGGSGIQGLSKGLKDGKPLWEWAESALEEGGEEMLQKFVGEAIAKVGYGSDKEMLNPIEYAKEGALGAISGAMLGGGQTTVQSGINAYAEHQAGKLTQNEQAVIKKEVENRISEQEKDGKKLTAKEKSAIETQVERDLEKGYISTDTIEEVLGGETYKAYKDTIESEDSLLQEFDTLYKMKQSDMTGEQIDRLAQLKPQAEEIRKNNKRDQLKTQLGEEVFNLAKGDRLAESYNERSRRGQAFEADLTKYDEKQKAVIQKAIDSGILNNTNRTHEFVDLVAKISADKGVAFDFTNNEKLKTSGFALEGKTINGYVTKDGISINIQSSKSLNTVVGHEITHVLEGTELYTELQKAVVDYAKAKGDFQGRYDSLAKLYEGVEGADIDAELTADLVGDYLFTDADFVNRLSTENRNVFQKVFDEIKYLCRVATAGSKEARQLEQVKRLFEQAYRENVKNTAEDGGVKYSLMEFDQDGRRFVEIDQDQDRFDGHSIDEYPKIAKTIINEKFNGHVIGADNKMFVNGSGRDEFANPSKHLGGDLYEAKMRTAGELDNLLDAGTNFRNAPDGADGHIHPDAIGGFDYYDTLFKIGNRYFAAVINIKNVKRGKLFKDVTKIKDVTQDIMSSYGNNPKSQFLRTSSKDIIRATEGNVNIKVSEGDPRRSLSEEGRQHPTYGNYNVYGEDVALELGPVREDVAPVSEVEGDHPVRGQFESPADEVAVEAEGIGPVKSEEAGEAVRAAAQERAAVPSGDIGPVVESGAAKANSNNGRPGQKQRKWVGTSTKSDAVDGKVLPDDLDQELIHYQPISNKQTLGNANAQLGRMGYDSSVAYLQSQLANNKVSLDDIALGERLIQEAVKRGDTNTAGELIMDISILGTELGQKVQALSIIKRLTPEGQLMMLKKTVERGKAKSDKAYAGVEVTKEMDAEILKAYKEDGSYDQDDLNRRVEEVKQQIADQMTVSAMEKVNAWRYLSMLGNPKTHIRNLVSNIAMQGTVKVKNALARTIETFAPIQNRTKTWKQPTEYIRDYAETKAVEMKDIISGDAKYGEDTTIKQKRDIFKTEILNKVYEFNNEWLEKEDWWFSKSAFKSSLSEFLTANGIRTEEDVKAKPQMVEKAIQYATEQSQIATFRQYSWLANKITDIEKRNTLSGMAVGAIMPFKKTPINIAKTGLAYSPLGFAKTLTYDISQVKSGNMEASELVDHLSQNVTGTALAILGYMLAKSGFISGAGDDDKEGKYDYQLGKQAYSVNIGGNAYSLAWLSPIAMPLFVGANAYEQLEEGKEWNGDVAVETLAQTLDPLSEMSFLSSLDEVLSSYDGGIQKFAAIGESMAQNYITQFAPTLLGQVATVMDDTKRSTKVAGDSDFKFVDETINQLKYKIPGLRQTLEPTTDIWGNEVKQTEVIATRAFETFLAPYSLRESNATAVDQEIKALYRMAGEDSVLPKVPYNYVAYKDEKYEMSAEDHTNFKKTYGQLAYNLLEDLFGTKTYKKSTAAEKADLVEKVYDYARDEAKREFLAGRGIVYTNATKDKVPYYKENAIKGAIKMDVTPEEYSYYMENPEKYAFFKELGITYTTYKQADEDAKEAYSWAYNNPEGYLVSKAVTNDVVTYRKYVKQLDSIKSKDKHGDTISESVKDRKAAYINSLDIDYGEKLILYRNEYKSDDSYNREIVEYLNGRADISFEEEIAILRELGFEVTDKGVITWD